MRRQGRRKRRRRRRTRKTRRDQGRLEGEGRRETEEKIEE